MRSGYGLRRRISGVPLVLMTRMEDKSQIARGVTANERSAIHYCGHLFQALRKLDVIDGGINRWKSAEHLVRIQSGFVRRVALGIEGFGVGHASAHPKDNDGIGSGAALHGVARIDGPCVRSRQSGESGSAGSLQKITA